MTAQQPASSLPTRQQLDEIDALLRRMLSLPSVGTESPPQAAPPPPPLIRETTPPGHEPTVQSWRVEWPQSASALQPSVVAWGAPVTAVPITTMPIASAVPMGYAATLMPPPYALPMFEAANRSIPARAGYPTQTATFVEQPPPSTIAPPALTFYWPMVVFNSIFDVMSYLLPFGGWMRGAGRPILGWLGILMLLAAGGWAYGEWSGYEWPKIDIAKIFKLK